MRGIAVKLAKTGKGQHLVISEDSFTSSVIDYARIKGWRVAHFRPAQTKDGKWRTAVQGDGKGFPDLVLLRGDRIIFAELKSEVGKASEEQIDWIESLRLALGFDAAQFWKPSDWPKIEEILN